MNQRFSKRLINAQKILDATYEKIDLNSRVEEMTNLNQEEKQALKKLLFKFEDLFDGTLGEWTCKPVQIKLKPGSKPHHSRAFSIPKIHEET